MLFVLDLNFTWLNIELLDTFIKSRTFRRKVLMTLKPSSDRYILFYNNLSFLIISLNTLLCLVLVGTAPPTLGISVLEQQPN